MSEEAPQKPVPVESGCDLRLFSQGVRELAATGKPVVGNILQQLAQQLMRPRLMCAKCGSGKVNPNGGHPQCQSCKSLDIIEGEPTWLASERRQFLALMQRHEATIDGNEIAREKLALDREKLERGDDSEDDPEDGGDNECTPMAHADGCPSRAGGRCTCATGGK